MTVGRKSTKEIFAVIRFLWDTYKLYKSFRLTTHKTQHERKDLSLMATKLSRTKSPVEATLSLISDKWKILILRDLLTGTKRFGELKKSIGSISQKVLTSNLRAMEDDGLLVREVYAEVPPRVEYTLTERGESMRPIIDSMAAWGEAHMDELAADQA